MSSVFLLVNVSIILVLVFLAAVPAVVAIATMSSGRCLSCSRFFSSLVDHRTKNEKCRTALKRGISETEAFGLFFEELAQQQPPAPPLRHEFAASSNEQEDEHDQEDELDGAEDDAGPMESSDGYDIGGGAFVDEFDEGTVLAMEDDEIGSYDGDEDMAEEQQRGVEEDEERDFRQRFPSNFLQQGSIMTELNPAVANVPIVLANIVMSNGTARSADEGVLLPDETAAGGHQRVTQNTSHYVESMERRSLRLVGSGKEILASKTLEEYCSLLNFDKAQPRPLNAFEEKLMVFAEKLGLSLHEGEELMDLFKEFGVETTIELDLSSKSQHSPPPTGSTFDDDRPSLYNNIQQEAKGAVDRLLPRKFKTSRALLVRASQMETPCWKRPVSTRLSVTLIGCCWSVVTVTNCSP